MPHSLWCKTFLWLSLTVAIASSASAATGLAPVPGRLPVQPAVTADDPLAAVLSGEFSIQAGLLGEAAGHYLTAARVAGNDAILSERATRLALLANELPMAREGLALWQAQSPDALGARSAGAVIALRSDDVDAAQPVLAALMTDPDPEAGKAAAGALLSAGGHPQAVSAVLGRLLDAGQLPSQAVVWQELGRLVARLDDTVLAGQMIDAAIRQFPDDPRVRVLQARQLAQTGESAAALTILASLKDLAADDPAVRNALAVQYEAMGQWALGAEVMAMGPQDGDTVALRAAFLVRLQDREALQTLYDSLAQQGGRQEPGRRLLLGKLAEYLQLPDQALDWYRGVPGGNERVEARLRTALVLMVAGRVEQAITQVRGMQGDAGLPDLARRDAYLLESELHRRQQGQAEELRVLNQGLAAFPNDPALLYARGLAWEREGNVTRAEADLRQLLAADPDNASVLNALGYVLADRTDRYEEALALISRALVAEPDNPSIIDSHGWVLFRLGRHAEARDVLRRAWSLQREAEVGAHLAEVLLSLGQRDEALRIFKQAQQLDPEHRAIQLLHDRLRP